MANNTYRAQPRQTLWQHALREDSNLEFDWLWLYTQVVTDAQRLVCLHKALHINGCNAQTRRMLAALEQQSALSSRRRTCGA